MKNYEKLLIVMLVITVITSILSISVCAEETYTVSGVYEFVENIDISSISIGHIENVNGTFKGNPYHYSFDKIQFKNSTINGTPGTSINVFCTDPGYNKYMPIWNTITGSAWSPWYIDFGDEPQTVSAEFYNWLIVNKASSECDGTCAVPDENLDGICEDCGKPFSLRNTGYAYTHSVKINSANGIIEAEYMSNEPFTIRGYLYGATYRVEPSIGVNCIAYLNGEITYQGVVANHYPSRNLDDTIISSTFDWYTSSDSDEIFFPLPLWATVETVAQGELTEKTLPTMGGTMKILVVCGVGLMACLVVLKLFGKRSLIYRN